MRTGHLEDYELTLSVYQGPLHKLLDLIEEQKLEITSVALAKVTGDFLAYIEQLGSGAEDASAERGPAVFPELLADFLVVASQLLLIKSRALLPSLEVTPEEEEDMRDLELRLKLYQELKATQRHVRELWHEMPVMVGREFLAGAASLFYPPKKVGPEALAKALMRLSGELERILRPQATLKREIVNLRQKIEEIVSRLSLTPISFRAFRAGKSRGELAFLFLAVLHLVRQRLIEVEQRGHFTDITIARRNDLRYNEER